MLTLRRYPPTDEREVWRLHVLALEAAGAYIVSGPWDDDLREIEAFYLAQRGEFLVGFLEQTLVAMGALKEVAGDTAEIKRMRVHSEHQRRGYETQMLVQLENTAKRLGYRALVLDTSTSQGAALQLYLKAGYR